MLAGLSVCTREEQRSVIRFLWAEGVKGAEIHARLCTQYGNNALPRRSVYEWIEMFENGRTSSKNFKSQPSAGKLLLTVFWDSQWPIREHYMEKCVTVTSGNY